MKWTLRYAVLLAALVLALGSVGMMRPEVATANDDVVFLDPPNDRGDPDDGGPSRYFGVNATSWFASVRRSISLVTISASRRTVQRGPNATSRSQPTRVRQK